MYPNNKLCTCTVAIINHVTREEKVFAGQHMEKAENLEAAPCRY